MKLRFGPDATIANGASQSNAFDLHELGLCGLIMPAGWDAADITLLASTDAGGTFKAVYDKDGNEMTIKASASRYIALQAIEFAGLKLVKLRSGTSGVPVNQTAARIITIVSRKLV